MLFLEEFWIFLEEKGVFWPFGGFLEVLWPFGGILGLLEAFWWDFQVFEGNMVKKWTNEPCSGVDEVVNTFWVLTELQQLGVKPFGSGQCGVTSQRFDVPHAT